MNTEERQSSTQVQREILARRALNALRDPLWGEVGWDELIPPLEKIVERGGERLYRPPQIEIPPGVGNQLMARALGIFEGIIHGEVFPVDEIKALINATLMSVGGHLVSGVEADAARKGVWLPLNTAVYFGSGWAESGTRIDGARVQESACLRAHCVRNGFVEDVWGLVPMETIRNADEIRVWSHSNPGPRDQDWVGSGRNLLKQVTRTTPWGWREDPLIGARRRREANASLRREKKEQARLRAEFARLPTREFRGGGKVPRHVYFEGRRWEATTPEGAVVTHPAEGGYKPVRKRGERR